jgi:hypothetical protein
MRASLIDTSAGCCVKLRTRLAGTSAVDEIDPNTAARCASTPVRGAIAPIDFCVITDVVGAARTDVVGIDCDFCCVVDDGAIDGVISGSLAIPAPGMEKGSGDADLPSRALRI